MTIPQFLLIIFAFPLSMENLSFHITGPVIPFPIPIPLLLVFGDSGVPHYRSCNYTLMPIPLLILHNYSELHYYSPRYRSHYFIFDVDSVAPHWSSRYHPPGQFRSSSLQSSFFDSLRQFRNFPVAILVFYSLWQFQSSLL